MRTIKNITASAIIALTAIVCLAHFSPKKKAPACSKYEQSAAASITDAEDFSLVNLLTLKLCKSL